MFPRGVFFKDGAYRIDETSMAFFVLDEKEVKKRKLGSANGNRTRISALKGPRANRCTIAPGSISLF